MISVIAETLRGSVSLRSYQVEKYQEFKYSLCAETSASSQFHFGIAETYFFLKVEMLMGGLAIALTAAAVVFVKITGFGYDGSTES